MIQVFGRSERGSHSEENEDGFLAWSPGNQGYALVVCDGMGGMGRGAAASRAALEFLEGALAEGGDTERLLQVLSEADLHLRRQLADGPGAPGCTAACVLIHGDQAYVAWAGDARAYLIRTGQVVARTRDHKLIEELLEAGHLTPEEARRSPMAHVVTRALGGRREGQAPHQPEGFSPPWTLQPGDALVLCSDGVCDVLDDVHFASLVAGKDAKSAANALVEAAQRLGSDDDITALVAVYGAEWSTPGSAAATPTAPAPLPRLGRIPDSVTRPEVSDPLLTTPIRAVRASTPPPVIQKRSVRHRRPESRWWMWISALLLLIIGLLVLFLAWPAKADPGTEIVVLLDTSCSMGKDYALAGQRRPASDAQRQAQLSALLLEGLTRGQDDRLTLIPFHGAPMTDPSAAAIRDLGLFDGTPYLPALRAGSAMLRASPRGDRMLVFVSDGEPTDYVDPAEGASALGADPPFEIVVLGLLPPDRTSAADRAPLEAYLRALGPAEAYVAVDDAADLTREMTAAWAQALGSKALAGTLEPGSSSTFRVGRFVSEVMIVTAGAPGTGPFTARVTNPSGEKKATVVGDNGCTQCSHPPTGYAVWRFDHNPDEAVDVTLTVDRARGPVSFGVILRYDLAARAKAPAVAPSGGVWRVDAHLDWRGQVFADEPFFQEDGFAAVVRVGAIEVPMRVGSDGRFVADVPVDLPEGQTLVADVIFRNAWMEERTRLSAVVEAPPRLTATSTGVDLGTWTAGGWASERCGDATLEGELPPGTSLGGTFVGDAGAVRLTAVPAGTAEAPSRTWRICAVAPRCCGASTAPPDQALVLTAAATPGEIRVPVRWRVEPASFWVCWGPWIAALVGGALLAWIIAGLLRGHDFEPDARVRVAGSERQLGRASAVVLREQPRGRRGFYRNARICLTASGEFVASPSRAVVHLEADRGGHARFHLRGPLERQDRRTRQWVPVTDQEAGEGPGQGTLYRCGDLYLRFD
jgi:protein phosphatase